MPLLQGLVEDVTPTTSTASTGRSLPPEGPNLVTIVNTEEKPFASGLGLGCILHFESDTGDIFNTFITTCSTEYPELAQKGCNLLAGICQVAGVEWEQFSKQNTEVIHGRKVIVIVKHKPSKDKKDDGTFFMNAECVAYKKVEEAPTPSAGTEKAPW